MYRLMALAPLFALLASTTAYATSVYTHITETDSYTNQPFHLSGTPLTVNHPNPIHGFASTQGVSALTGNGAGLAAHARVDLVPGANVTRSTAIAAIEFEIVDPSTATQAPIGVSLLGQYLTGVFGKVRVHLWRGIANHRGSSGNAPQLLFFAGPSMDSDVGLWSVDLNLNTRQLYTLELEATAEAFNGFNSSSVAFIDPVFSFSAGAPSGIQLNFQPESLLDNPAFVPSPVPEPAASALVALSVAGVFFSRQRGQ